MYSNTSPAVAAVVRACTQINEYVIAPRSADAEDYSVIHLSGRNYTVNLDRKHCTCPSFRRHQVCKHLRMVQLQRAESDVMPTPAPKPIARIAPAEESEPRPSLEEELRCGLQDEDRLARARADRDALWPV